MPEYRSEVRESEKQALSEKVSKSDYGKYLKRIILRKLRSFTDREVTFDFPVTALIGPNGGGKTTILGAAGLAYKEVQPRRFFAKSGSYDASMKDWIVEYEIIDKALNPKLPVQRTASFPKQKWNRKALDREVLIFGVDRTVPASERKELTRAVGSAFSAAREVTLTEPVANAVESILGKPIAGYSRLFVDKAGKAVLFAGVSVSGDRYSEFHFGAGEASVIRIVAGIEAASENSLILVEEIENGLHPVAVRALVEYLMSVAQRKSCQVIFTTHSNDALDPLPNKAIWAAYNGELLQGKLDINALRTITGQVDAQLAVFAEDEFAVLMVQTALRNSRVPLDVVKVHSMGGANPAVEVNRQHNVDPTSSFPSICFVDGDRPDLVKPAENVLALPGQSDPESHVFEVVRGALDSEAGRLTVALQLPTSEQGRVREVVERRGLTNHDRHVVFQQIGDDLDFTAELMVQQAFLTIWAQQRPDEVAAIARPVQDLLTPGPSTPGSS